jgi:hypothetical protein
VGANYGQWSRICSNHQKEILIFKLAKSYINSEKKNREPKVVVKRGVVEIAYDSYKKGKDVALSLLAIKPRLKGLSFKWPFLPHVKVGVKFLPAEYVSNYDTIDDCQRNLERKLRDAYKSL